MEKAGGERPDDVPSGSGEPERAHWLGSPPSAYCWPTVDEDAWLATLPASYMPT